MNEKLRLMGYAAAILAGFFCLVWGAVHENFELVWAGLGLITTGGLAGANVPATGKHANHD